MGLPVSDSQVRLILQSLETICHKQKQTSGGKKVGIRDKTTSHRKKYDLKSLSELAIHVLDQKTENSGQKRDLDKAYGSPPVDQPLHLKTSTCWRMVVQQCEPAGGASHSDADSFRGSFMQISGVQKLINRENDIGKYLKNIQYLRY